MAYCDNCGAYIPDGQSKCLACGFDENEAQAEKAAAAAATESAPKASGRLDSEFLRRQLEQQRQRQRESSKKWAEAEHARRQQQEKQAESYAGPRSCETQNKTPGSAISNKTFAALSYLGILCFLPMLLCPGDDFAMYHARQGLGLFIMGVACNILSAILGFGWLVSLAWVYLIYKGITTAAAGKQEPLPYIGNLFLKK